MKPGRWRSRALRIAAAALATLLLVYCARGVDLSRVGTALASAQVGWIVLAVAADTLVLPLWAEFWRSLLPDGVRVARARMLGIVAAASAVMNSAPALAGQAVGVGLLVKRAGLSTHSALAVLSLDQLGEGIAKAAIFLLVGLMAPLPGWMHAAVITVSAGVLVLLVALVAFAHGVGARLPAASEALATRAARARGHIQRWATGLDVLRSWRRAGRALVHVLSMKCMDLIAIMAVARAMGVSLSLGGGLLVLAAVILATMLPLAPASLGAYEASVILAYRELGVPPETALAIAVLQHAAALLPLVGVGYADTLRRSAMARA